MKRFFAWIVPEEWLALMNAQGGVSPCYSVPVSIVAPWNEIAGSIVYIVSRSRKGDSVFARVSVDSVDEGIDDEGRVVDHLLNVKLHESLRTSRINNDADSLAFAVETVRIRPAGFSLLDDSDKDKIEAVISSGAKILFTRVPDNLLSRIDLPVMNGNSDVLPQVLVAEVVAHFTLSEIWGSMTVRHPVANFAYQYLGNQRAKVSDSVRQVCRDRLKTYFSSAANGVDVGGAAAPGASDVDVNLTAIVPSEVRVRHFTSSKSDVAFDEMLLKTESAERRHQDMLRDISSRCIEMGVTPYQSSSIDFALKGVSALRIFELKTTTPTNIMSQVAKGIFQLLYYSSSLEAHGVDIEGASLIVESGCDEAIMCELARVAAKANVQILSYDKAKPWPDRLTVIQIEGLPNRVPFALMPKVVDK